MPYGLWGERVRYEIPYAIGILARTEVKIEIHIGVIVSPAPRITPERL